MRSLEEVASGLLRVLQSLAPRIPEKYTFPAFLSVVAVLGFLVLGFRTPVVQGHALGWLVVAGLILILITTGLIAKLQSKGDAVKDFDARRNIAVWSRPIPRAGMAESTQHDLFQALQAARNAAIAKLGQEVPELKNAEGTVRANLFLPDTKNASFGSACELHIAGQLHVNMKDEKERGLRFRTDEGLTGRVYVRGAAEGAFKDGDSWRRAFFTKQTDDGEGPDYRLTDWQRDLIHDDLKWVLSFPLFVTRESRPVTVGVLNIDCIGDDLPLDVVRRVFKSLFIHLGTTWVMPISAALSSVPFDRVAILLQPEGNS